MTYIRAGKNQKKVTNMIYSGSVDDLKAIYDWRDELERKTLKLEDRMLDVLEGDWLREGKRERKKARV